MMDKKNYTKKLKLRKLQKQKSTKKKISAVSAWTKCYNSPSCPVLDPFSSMKNKSPPSSTVCAGVYIIKVIDIFATPPPFRKSYFFPKYIKYFPFSPFFPSLTPYMRVFLKKSSYFFPNLPKTDMKNIHPCRMCHATKANQ